MTSAKIRYIQNIYEKKYGRLGKIASRYIGAGYSVEFNHPTRYGSVSLLVRGKGSVMAIEVVDSNEKVDAEKVKVFIEKAKLLKAKPVLILYSASPKLNDDVMKLCRDNGVKIRRIKL
ncbi:MAG: hypothetical protein QXG46_05400 [Ignisphaera sp.]